MGERKTVWVECASVEKCEAAILVALAKASAPLLHCPVSLFGKREVKSGAGGGGGGGVVGCGCGGIR